MKTRWFYKDKENWGAIDKDYRLCESGKNQSPINIEVSHCDVLFEEKVLGTIYNNENFEVCDTGNVLVFKPLGNKNKVIYRGDVYWLIEISFHTPSDHSINGEHYPMEMQLVHQNIEGQYLNISIFFEIGDESNIIGDLFELSQREVSLNLDEMLPEDRRCFVYTGSLTMPPCTENADWVLFESSKSISKEQHRTYFKKYPDSNRSIQNSKDRHVFKGEA